MSCQGDPSSVYKIKSNQDGETMDHPLEERKREQKLKYRGSTRGGPKSRKAGGGLDVCMTLLRSLKMVASINSVVSTVSGKISCLKSLDWKSGESVLPLN